MLYQPELISDEVNCFKQLVRRRHDVEAATIIRNLDSQLGGYAARLLKLEDLSFQIVIIRVRAAIMRETTGPRGKEGLIFAAVLQRALDWDTLSEKDREAFSNFLEAERQRYQERADPDPAKWANAWNTMESRSADDDYILTRAEKTIKSPEHRVFLMNKLFSNFSQDAASVDPGHGCAKCHTTADVSKLKRCGSCKRVFYCSKECQAADWKAKHKYLCKVIAEVPKDAK